jgi:Protein of unknown function (DUF3224)
VATALMASTPVLAEQPVMHHAKGQFEVKLEIVSAKEDIISRMTLDKKFSGDLAGNSTGQMLSHSSEDMGTHVYVAIEKVTGTLGGKTGSFTLAHRGTMQRDGQQLSIIVVPDSGTGGLSGLTGTMTIDVDDTKKHFYTFDYTLPTP